VTFRLDEIVPWGRSFDEYAAMFTLSERDLAGRILGCGDGPSSFNATLSRRGGCVVSADPLYAFSAAEIVARLEATYDVVMAQTRANAQEFVWTNIPSVEALGALRRGAMEAFLADYPEGREAGRYVEASLPELPFAPGAFDLALCSHLLFLYGARLDLAFHVAALMELCRVAAEVRVFPLLELGATPSRHLEAVCEAMRHAGHEAQVLPVPYEFQRGGNQMLRVRGRASP
jgi:hypothetical protein